MILKRIDVRYYTIMDMVQPLSVIDLSFSLNTTRFDPGQGMWKCYQWLMFRRWFTPVSSTTFTLASHELTAIWQKRWRQSKIQIPNVSSGGFIFLFVRWCRFERQKKIRFFWKTAEFFSHFFQKQQKQFCRSHLHHGTSVLMLDKLTLGGFGMWRISYLTILLKASTMVQV